MTSRIKARPRPRHSATRMIVPLACALLVAIDGAGAQDLGTLDPKPLPPLAKPDDPNNPAKELFGRKTAPAKLKPEVVGFYAKGCLAGAQALPINGPTWQVMRLSRNRNWGHPSLVQFIERLSQKGAKAGWRGLLVGDMSQPRGGPMITGHASHQVGLDADIWLRPMPDREFTRQEREETSATMVVADSRKDVDPKVWTPAHFAIIKAAAEDPLVERVFVNAAIKKTLCQGAGTDRGLAAEGAALLGARLSLPRPYQMPGRQPHLQAPRPGARRRRLRQGAGLVVHRCGAPSQALARARETAPLHQDGRSAAVLPAGTGRALRVQPGGPNSGASTKARPTATRSPQPATTAANDSALSTGTRISTGSPAQSR